MQRYKSLFVRQKRGLFVNFGQFPCSRIRICIPNTDPVPQPHRWFNIETSTRNGWIRKNDYCVGVRRAEPAQQGGDREEEAEEQAGEQGEGRQAPTGGQVSLLPFLEVSTSHPKMNDEECRTGQSHLGTYTVR
jgi:hypothetical protein